MSFQISKGIEPGLLFFNLRFSTTGPHSYILIYLFKYKKFIHYNNFLNLKLI
jgi:hypothetical protein